MEVSGLYKNIDVVKFIKLGDLEGKERLEYDDIPYKNLTDELHSQRWKGQLRVRLGYSVAPVGFAWAQVGSFLASQTGVV